MNWHALSMVDMSVEQFEDLVANALDGIPRNLGAAMENVAVLVDRVSPPGRLLGLYQGIPLTRRDASYSATMPDRITIYMQTICHACDSEDQVGAMVHKTVIHEVAHHFGIDDEHLKEWGWA